jgi:hypothetical protein
MAKAFFFKLTLCDESSYFDLENPALKLSMGRTVHQPQLAKESCIWLHRTAEAALKVGLKRLRDSSSGRPKLAKTILKCSAWGDCIEGPSGRIAFSYMCPVADIGLKPGFIAFKVLRKSSVKSYAAWSMPTSPRRSKPRLIQSTVRNRSRPHKSPLEVSLVSELRARRRTSTQVIRPKIKAIPRLDYRQTLAKSKIANAKLEEEVAEIQRRGAEFGL